VSRIRADYYAILGVTPDADEETIREAFHAAARDCHPDVADSPEAGRRFRELAEAYDVLSTPESRELYDRYGYRGPGDTGIDADENGGARGASVLAEVELRDYEARDGSSRVVTYAAADTCPDCAGLGMTTAADPDCPDCGGTGRALEVSEDETARVLRVAPCETCGGEVCPECVGSGRQEVDRRLRVNIPAGIEDGAQLRVAGEGDVGERGGPPGDLLLDVRLLPAARDSRPVRYFALALLLVAVAVLVAYLLLR
jgi:molecular chaperone DnaJ